MRKKSKKLAYKYTLFLMLGVTRAISKVDYHIPSKWYSLIDSIQVSSSVLHERLSFVDDEVEEDFRQKEDMITRRYGDKKFYSEEELERVREKFDTLEVQDNFNRPGSL